MSVTKIMTLASTVGVIVDGELTISSDAKINVPTPTEATNAVPKSYVDAQSFLEYDSSTDSLKVVFPSQS